MPTSFEDVEAGVDRSGDGNVHDPHDFNADAAIDELLQYAAEVQNLDRKLLDQWMDTIQNAHDSGDHGLVLDFCTALLKRYLNIVPMFYRVKLEIHMAASQPEDARALARQHLHRAEYCLAMTKDRLQELGCHDPSISMLETRIDDIRDVIGSELKVNEAVNGHANGIVNGHANGTVNEPVNGNLNALVNGDVNGDATQHQ